MRTTLNLDDALMREAKATAARRGITLTRLVENALRAELAPKVEDSGYRFNMPVVHDTAPPAVDVADRDALYALMEEYDDADPE